MIKVKMFPHKYTFSDGEESGIRRVIEAYIKYLPKFGVRVVDPGENDFDLIAVHAGTKTINGESFPFVCHNHGLYWSADYAVNNWEWNANKFVIDNIRHANEITVPSEWVAEVFRRDLRYSPRVIPHGIEWERWQGKGEDGKFVLFNKNRDVDVCSTEPLRNLADRFPDLTFVSTIPPTNTPKNIKELGVIPHNEMKRIIQKCGVYLSSTKETFGIGVLEAMASGKPVLGFAYGGNLDLVQHGINGYLAKPGNYDDLAAGLVYCIQNQRVLGENGRELARQWTWENAVGMVAEVYQKALHPDPPTVSVIIPCYNYGEEDKLGRAIQSALEQTIKPEKIVVVDDGSTDGGATESIARRYADERPESVIYIRQANSGVAVARNTGIRSVHSKYIVCIDADDAIAPEFIERCIGELEADRSLGIAYTKLQWVRENGATGISDWPDRFNYDKQMNGQNQVPTCCMFRREMWERLGGYKPRYCPAGAGEEDAEFWLRAGAYGWGAKLVTEEPLFIYSWMTGKVSGDRKHKETNWRIWHPWTKDDQHPFASLATPKRQSHPVRQYDDPSISVIIPVGPNHIDTVYNALDSLEAQTFRKWEVIVAWDADQEIPDLLQKAYPYVRWAFTHYQENGSRGAGAARNLGVELSRAPFLFFLDADDILLPDCLQHHIDAWGETGAIVYSDYFGTAYIDELPKLAEDLQKRVIYRDEKSKETMIEYRALDFDCEKAQRQPELDSTGVPYLWCNVSCLIPKAWFDEAGGFDEKMPSWEDVDLHWRFAKMGKCYYHLAEPLLTYRFYTGERREKGLQEFGKLIKYLQNKYKGVKNMACGGGCGGKRRNQTASQQVTTQYMPKSTSYETRIGLQGSTLQGVSMADDDYILIDYAHPNTGMHSVIGAATKTNYGYRARGEKFLVRREDAAAQPGYFKPVQVEIPAPEKPAEPLPVPVPVAAKDEPVSVPVPVLVAVKEEIAAEATEPVAEVEEVEPELDLAPAPAFNLETIPGVTPNIAEQLREHDVNNPDDIVEFGLEGLLSLKRIGESRANMIYGYCKKLVEEK